MTGILGSMALTKTTSTKADADTKCDNHPDRKAKTFTGGGAFEIHLCDECTPAWFKASQ